MSLPHAILGFLQVMPMTGYDLKTRAFDQSVAHFWSAVQQQIYRELEKMEGLGWVTCTVELQTERPPRKVYHISDAGRAALDAWLKQPQPLVQHREPFLIQLFFAAQLTNSQIVALFHDQLTGHQARLEAYQGVVIPPSEDLSERRRRTLVGLTLDLGVRMEQMYIDWLTEAIAVVERLPYRDE
ncbi:MAG: PadR family transcriptional regulator [Chloroflexi bacterium]|nr:PadR family transcriptional regulator [Chloroflexota bacterium]